MAIMGQRSTDKTRRLTEMMNRVCKAIRDFDPSYRFKKRGWICAKEWREICPPPFDYIWGAGYTGMAKRLPEDKIPVLRSAAKNTIKLDGWSSDFISMHPKTLLLGSVENINKMPQINGHDVDWDIIRYAMHDIDVIGGIRRQKEASDFMKGVSS